jgi:hypothetical protein
MAAYYNENDPFEGDERMKYGTRHGLSDQALNEVAAERGREVERLRLQLAIVERERDAALERVRELEGRRTAKPEAEAAPPPVAGQRFVVKVQRPLASSCHANPRALIYDRDCSVYVFTPMSASVETVLGDKLKAYAWAQLEDDGGTLRILKPAPAQDW